VSHNSIKGKLITTVVASQLLLAAGVMSVVVSYTRQQLIRAFDAALHARAMSIVSLLPEPEENHSDARFDPQLIPPVDPRHADLYEVQDDARILVRSPNWPAGWDADGLNGGTSWNFQLSRRPFRAIRVTGVPMPDDGSAGQIPGHTLTVFYAAETSEMQRQVRAVGMVVAIATLALVGVTALLAVWGIRRGLGPLHDLAAQASAISAQNWEFRPPGAARETQELAPLTQAIENMLAGLQRSFTQQREFLGNAAHELKTPVAIVKSTLQSLLHKPRSNEEYRMGLEQSLHDVARLENLLQSMLRLARAEQWAAGGHRGELESVEMATTCQEAIERLHGLADDRGITIEFRGDSTAALFADREDLTLIWVNLLENAIRYSPEGETAWVILERANRTAATVSFEDRGPGIPTEELSRVFERFHRGDSSRSRESGGFGLGLAIAKALIEAYGGKITATNVLPHGTRMVVELPIPSNP
jgi:signal transduction histidine kinase